MSRVKKSLLAFMAIVLALGLMPLPVFADEAVSGDNDTIEESEGVLDSQDPEEESDGKADDAASAGLENIAFVLVESPSIAQGAVENIVVGFANEDLAVESAELVLAKPDGSTDKIKQSKAVEGAVLFAVDASTLAPGKYVLTELTYRASEDGEETAVEFSQDEAADYSFEVIDASAGEPSDDSEVVTTAYAINADDELFETGDIGEAMAAAGVDPEAGPNADSSDSENGMMAQSKASEGFVIVLDPGHGGSDPGASGYGLQENIINLKIAQACKAKLEQTPGVTVYMTRTNDTYVSLDARTEFAVSHNADLVVSLHNNASGVGSARGAEVIVPRDGSWYYSETYVTGTELGYKILDKLNKLGIPTHSGVYSRDSTSGERYPDGTLSDYYSLIDGPRWNGILGIIIEHAFIDNASDTSAFLNSDAKLKALGEADANAIIEYYSTSKGLDREYAGVYNYDYYVSHNADAKAAANGNRIKAFDYFVKTGMAKGQRANAMFDVSYYKEHNADLQKAYGNDLKKYYDHFLQHGMSEGRQGSADFDPKYYKSAYKDLQDAYGNNWYKYYTHYANYGMAEGRKAVAPTAASSSTNTNTSASTNTSSASQPLYRLYKKSTGEHHYTLSAYERDYCVRNWGWTDEGVAWYCPSSSTTPVYRLYNKSTGLHHYTTSEYERDYCIKHWGWTNEGIGWYAVDSGQKVYRLYHKGTGHHHYTLSAYERDYCVKNWGWTDEGVAWYSPFDEGGSESSSSVAADDEAIMGASKTSVAQMVRRYNAVGKSYPSSVYSKYGASSINQFCQILYEEATTEGVRPEAVFAQTMHETGWLQFGGDVKAEQCNFAGIGATGGGNPGNSFNDWGANSVRKGLRAQVQHLKAYASTDSCKNSIVDPRFTYVTRGCAPTVKALGGKWATSSSYGTALVNQIRSLLSA